MITPKFSVQQDDTTVTVVITAPHVRAATIELDVNGDQLTFYAAPYYLRLTFPGRVVEDENSKAQLDHGSNNITVILTKETPGEVFENLDMLTSLLATRRERDAAAGSAAEPRKPHIEEIGGGQTPLDLKSMLEDEDFDWEIPQRLQAADNQELADRSKNYGFDLQYNQYFANIASDGNGIMNSYRFESMDHAGRRERRMSDEYDRFDEDYYIENFMNDEEIMDLIHYKTQYHKALRRIQKTKKANGQDAQPSSSEVTEADMAQDPFKFTEEENRAMMGLSRRTYMVTHEQTVYLGLVELLFAYSYDHRINHGEQTVESSRQIGRLSAQMSCLDHYTQLRDTVVTCFRRALVYPLYRNWELCERVLSDVYILLRLGRRTCLKVLLELKTMFDHHDEYYLYSKTLFDDYCVWLQTTANDKVIRSLAHQINHIEIEKDEVGWHLETYEDLALETSEEEEESDSDEAVEWNAEMGLHQGIPADMKEPAEPAPPLRKPLIEVVGDSVDTSDAAGASAPTKHTGTLATSTALLDSELQDKSSPTIILPTASQTDEQHGADADPSGGGKKPLIEML
ncbi:hypothetical protein EC988_003658 [Linderina pennispora]|nr:hypothetical protein EC988_003658 [Linderina pennispora]